ncbi:double-strand break repair helicase AddA [Aliiroseovarius sp. F47248L]|uniref:double-strand break repair helicase AddA n=1 Tax=Aliiroseovarius sp. F47248L TaxID=2926420 RepID=UPI001FF40BAB|nr:double-strand break repair helicase AddA [Aliiroseovarius sp. F47248L]MCK0140136.1 double-strand break repair helicase AddA [Aliiroseovarius sp. F47248L]
MTLNDATRSQIRAADPKNSTWLSANAGSGKTRVLTDRVARLLLEGVSPQNILCLTYTKAAASEMQNRLFNRLGEWAMKDDTALTAALQDLGLDGARDLSLARQLFARAIETPGGLKIQTIHAYAASLLRRFPMEAGVSPQFTEMDDRTAKDLRADLLDRMSVGPLAKYVTALSQHFTGEDMAQLTAEITGNRTLFIDQPTDAEIAKWFGVSPALDERTILDILFQPGDLQMLAMLHDILATGSATEQKAAGHLTGADLSAPSFDILDRCARFLINQKPPYSAKSGTFPTKSMRAGACADIVPQLDDFMQRVEDAHLARIALSNVKRTSALHRFAHNFVHLYEEEKLARGWLDFDDLILKAGAILTDSAIASWVLFRLDGGIDHILVDEAQDTSPAQWRIIDSLAREFTSGIGARDGVERTIFVVGDPKQSIYSFQGAEPAAFDQMRATFTDRLSQIGRSLVQMPLEYSFRSSRAVLEFVDLAMKTRSGLGGDFLHRAFFANLPGRVDLWPAIEPVTHDEDRDWHDPVDAPSPQDHRVQLAESIADDIDRMINTETIPAEDGTNRPVNAGDILVLVRSRKELFHEIIRACKARAIPIAGADQLKIGAELAVKDLTALLSFLATPEDDLSLAAILRSPLFGWSEDDLFRLAHPRSKGKFLWRALSDKAEQYSETLRVLQDLRDTADFLRPYELLERALTRHGGRQKFLARLGQEAEDGIDALLAQAIGYERSGTPSLTGFLTWLQTDEVTIKRQMDSVGQQVRVMTIHGSKGLEAPIVILPDLAQQRASSMPAVAKLSDGQAIFSPKQENRTEAIEAVARDLKDAEIEERARLLYVAMTRAERWLILAAAGAIGKPDSDVWYRICEGAMTKAASVDCDFPTGPGKRFAAGNWPEPTVNQTPEHKDITSDLPGWLTSRVDTPVLSAKPISPSDLGGAKTLAGEDAFGNADDAKTRGRQIHLLLEHLPGIPTSRWKGTARFLLGSGDDRASDAEQSVLLDEAAGVLTAPELAPIFARADLAEVPVTATLPQFPERVLHGVIDRLIISDDEVLAVDFKTNRVVPASPEDTPNGLLRQLGAYRAVLRQIYPDRNVSTAILWTQSRELMRFENALVDAAFRHLDATRLPT